MSFAPATSVIFNPLKDSGCYAQDGMVAFHERRISDYANAHNLSAETVAMHEARAIRYHAPESEGHPLRLHVSGDCRTNRAAEIVSRACAKWLAAVWTYSHAWRDVRRSSWGCVSVLASIEDPKDGPKAIQRGYAPALVVAEHPEDGRAFESNGVKYVPCPAQTTNGRITCIKCRLCFDAKALRERHTGIAFAVHGSRRSLNRARSHLPVLNNTYPLPGVT